MRTFVRLRKMLYTNIELRQKFEELKRRIEKHDITIKNIFEVIRQLMSTPEKPKYQIGFRL